MRKCRELRQSKKVHSKCTCNPKNDHTTKELVNLVTGQKSRRFIPIVPALPNGLRDALTTTDESSLSAIDVRQKVDSLLNPCNCKNLWKCRCNRSQSTTSAPSEPFNQDLNALANAAVLQCCQAPTSESLSESNENPKKHHSSRPRSPFSYKRTKSSAVVSSTSWFIPHSGLELPPIHMAYNLTPGSSQGFVDTDCAVMPPMSTIKSLAGTGCTCGVLCACPGCAEHRTNEAENDEPRATQLRDCADGCTQCIDHSLRVLPGTEPNYTSPIDMFFTTMAAIPPPPTMRGPGGVSLVKLPKLECCGGQCGCPNGRCSCNTVCVGCCLEEEREVSLQASLQIIDTPQQSTHIIRSCCAEKS
ncbi:hypothetical protein BDQ17DRAFT_1536066 [Cyathus striatus]|nr:hypothetical protein BDQ17DRAFT_1536066 [Cyathus striatus]